MKEIAMIGAGLCLIAMVLVMAAACAPRRPRPMVTRKGIELLAEGGKLVHVRETSSEVEL